MQFGLSGLGSSHKENVSWGGGGGEGGEGIVFGYENYLHDFVGV